MGINVYFFSYLGVNFFSLWALFWSFFNILKNKNNKKLLIFYLFLDLSKFYFLIKVFFFFNFPFLVHAKVFLY